MQVLRLIAMRLFAQLACFKRDRENATSHNMYYVKLAEAKIQGLTAKIISASV